MKETAKILFICLLAIIMFSCGNKSTKHEGKTTVKSETKDSIGLYVYLDMAGVLHTKNGCKAVYKDRSMQVVRPVNPVDLLRSNLNRICSQCVSESQLLDLEGLIGAKEQASYLEGDTVAAEYDPDTDDPDNNWGY